MSQLQKSFENISSTKKSSDLCVDVQFIDQNEGKSTSSQQQNEEPQNINSHQNQRRLSKYNYEITFKSYVDPTEANMHSRYYDPNHSKKRPTYHTYRNFSGASLPSIKEREGPLIPLDDNTSSTDSELSQNHHYNTVKMDDNELNEDEENKTNKYGTQDGVFTSCLLNIFGVIMFLRIGQIVGHAGILLTLTIIWLATLVVLLTSLSMSAICTNGVIKAGGAYYMISRSLGPSAGAAVGFLFSIGMSVAVALYVIGFMETLVTQLPNGIFTGSDVNNARVFGIFLTVILLIVALIGVGQVIKVQLILLGLLFVSILSFFVGLFLSPDPQNGFIGFSSEVAKNNFLPDFNSNSEPKTSFLITFSVFFPAVTGIMAGANISGDLKNPSVSIPKGTLIAVIFSSIVYSLIAIFIGCVTNRTDLKDNYLIMTVISAQSPLVYAGIYAATFSSALASLVGAPRVAMSLAKDNLLPFLSILARTRSNGDPLIAYIVSFIIALACVSIGLLNEIAPLITMFFMMTYALINFSCFQLSLAKSPGQRPQFKYYSKQSALLGTFLCIIMMFVLKQMYAIVASFIAIVIYIYIDYKKPDVNWGSAPEGLAMIDAIQSLMKLRLTQKHTKNFRPNYLVMTGKPELRMHLVHFVHTLRKGFGAVFLGNVEIINQTSSNGYQHKWQQYSQKNGEDYIDATPNGGIHSKLKSAPPSRYFVKKSTTGKSDMIMFNSQTYSSNFTDGVSNIICLTGIGYLRPNTFIIGYKKDWTLDRRETDQYVDVIRLAFSNSFGVLICRNLEIFDFDKCIPDPFGTVDVQQIFDDGGLTVLIPYLMEKSEFWKSQTEGPNVPIRLFIISEPEDSSEHLKRVSNLLSRFRINQINPICVSSNGIEASGESIAHYNNTILPYTMKNDDNSPDIPNVLQTNRWIRVSELMREHSKKAKIIFCTIPFPRPHMSALEFMGLLELLSEDMPPFVMIRGNGESVLTWYHE